MLKSANYMYKERYPTVFTNIKENFKSSGIKKVSFDIDGIGQATFVRALNNTSHMLGTHISKSDLKTYWELNKIAQKNGIPENKAFEFTKNIWNTNEVYETSPMVQGFRSLMHIIYEISIDPNVEFEYIFVSSRPPEFLNTTRYWYSQNFPWIDKDSFFLGRTKGTSGGYFKSTIINERNIDLHIEDAIEEAVEIDKLTKCRQIIVPQPWNTNEHTSSSRIHRLDGYSEYSGVWPLLKFLSSNNARSFLSK